MPPNGRRHTSMLTTLHRHGPFDRALAPLDSRRCRLSRQRLRNASGDEDAMRLVLETARFSPGLPLRLADLALPDGTTHPGETIADDVAFAAQAQHLAAAHLGCAAEAPSLRLTLALGHRPVFIATLDLGPETAARPSAPARAASSLAGQSPATVRAWFAAITDTDIPRIDGSLDAAQRAAHAYALRAKAGNTRRAYRAGVQAWCSWAEGHRLPCLPARSADIAAFLADERGRGLAPATLELRRASLTYLHRLAGCPVPTADAAVGETMAGIQRQAAEDGFRPARKAAATDEVLARILAPIDRRSLAGARDTLLLLLGFWGAFRRSELACLQLRDVIIEPRGLAITLPVSKGDRRADGVTVSVPHGTPEFCAVAAYGRWLAVSGVRTGAVFRRVRSVSALQQIVHGAADAGLPHPVLGTAALTDRSIARIIQSRATAAGLDGALFGGHSLKRGVLTTGERKRVPVMRLKRLARHKTFSALDPYLESGDPFDEHPLA